MRCVLAAITSDVIASNGSRLWCNIASPIPFEMLRQIWHETKVCWTKMQVFGPDYDGKLSHSRILLKHERNTAKGADVQ